MDPLHTGFSPGSSRGETDTYVKLWTNLFVKPVFALITDLDNNSAFDGIAFLSEGHISSDTMEILDFRHGITNQLTVFFDMSR